MTMIWDYFIIFASVALCCWGTGAMAAMKGRNRILVYTTTIAGLVVFFAFIVGMWVTLERLPLRTMGETRLWYSFFLMLCGLTVYIRKKLTWILFLSFMMAKVFIIINIVKPEIHSKTLMPALQSPWFAPHVIVYMFAYALLGCATVIALFLLWKRKTNDCDREISLCDTLIYTGVAFITMGMLFGALWAKEAWGHYWSWDPKETWAAITWLSFLIYIHYRKHKAKEVRHALYILIVSFMMLQICWYGINYLPSARGASIHTYSSY